MPTDCANPQSAYEAALCTHSGITGQSLADIDSAVQALADTSVTSTYVTTRGFERSTTGGFSGGFSAFDEALASGAIPMSRPFPWLLAAGAAAAVGGAFYYTRRRSRR